MASLLPEVVIFGVARRPSLLREGEGASLREAISKAGRFQASRSIAQVCARLVREEVPQDSPNCLGFH